MRLRMTEENIRRSTDRENSSSGLGTTSMTRPCPSASMRASRGLTTVVLPAPMIICFTRDWPCLRDPMNSWTSWTCSLRSMMFHVNSNTRNRGSHRQPPRPPSGPEVTKWRAVSRAPARASAFWTTPETGGGASACRRRIRSPHVSRIRLTCPIRLAFSSSPVSSLVAVWKVLGVTNGFSRCQSSKALVDRSEAIWSSSHIRVSCPQ
mmetsp:Transcript_70148/g.123670  ORF Transcript_70148/g.123670 Transcript_70148/m.123670 type:complete len:207 (-) Transcript_70148:7862-8482(-)